MTSTTMKALRIDRESSSASPSLVLKDVPIPQLQPGDVLVQIHASAIQPSDILNTQGGFPYTKFPRTPGRDFSGKITFGTYHLVGKEIYGTSGPAHSFTVDGFQAEYAAISEKEIAIKPSNLSWEQAACVGVPFTTASLVLKRSGAKKGESVLVLGANGAVGSAVVQLARCLGCRVLRAVRGTSGDVDTSSDPEFNTVMILTEGSGVDVVIDTIGQVAMTRAATLKLAKRGRLAFITAPRNGITDLGIEMKQFYRNENVLLGCNSLLYSGEEMAEIMASFAPLFESGTLTAPKQGQWTAIELNDAVDAYKSAGKDSKLKFVVTLG